MWQAKKDVLKWVSLEPRFPSLQELAEAAAPNKRPLAKPRESLFGGEGFFKGELVSFDHCRSTLGQRKLWKGLHRKQGSGLFLKLLVQIAEPEGQAGVSWLEVAFVFGDHQWLYKLLNSKLFPIDDRVLRHLSIRVLGYSPDCRDVDPADIYALPTWNECSRLDGGILSDILERIDNVQLQRVLPGLLLGSSEFGFGSAAIFEVLVTKAGPKILRDQAEDLLVRLIYDALFDDLPQYFLAFLFPLSPPRVYSFDPAFARVQAQKLSFLIVELKKKITV